MTDQDRVEYFKNEILMMSSQVVDLLDERDQLRAQVKQLRGAYKKVSAAICNIDDTETDSEEIADALWSDLFKLLQDGYELCQSTPAQCLAEIKAQTVEAVRDHYKNKFPSTEKFTAAWIIEGLEQYANQLRQQVKP